MPTADDDAEPLAFRLLGELPNTLHLREPHADGPSWEAALAEALRAARGTSCARLRSVIDGFDVVGLLGDGGRGEGGPLRSRSTPTVRRGRLEPDVLDALDPAGVLDTFAAWGDVSAPRLVFAHGGASGHHTPPSTVVMPPSGQRGPARLSPIALTRALADGETAVLHSIDEHHAPLRALIEDIERVARTQSGANAYLSAGPAPGFGWHWDDHDLLVVQLIGRKHWDVRAPLDDAPMRPYTAEDCGTDVAFDGELDEGDVLFVPRGFGHRAEGANLSLHYAIPIRRPRWLDVLGYCMSVSGHWPLWRGDIPYDWTHPVESYGPALLGGAAPMRDALGDLLGDDVVHHGLCQWAAKVSSRASTSVSSALALVGTAWPDQAIRAATPGGWLIADEPVPAEQGADAPAVAFAAARQVIMVERPFLGLVAAVAGARRVALTDLAEVRRIDDGEPVGLGHAVAFAQMLAEARLVELCDLTGHTDA